MISLAFKALHGCSNRISGTFQALKGFQKNSMGLGIFRGISASFEGFKECSKGSMNVPVVPRVFEGVAEVF